MTQSKVLALGLVTSVVAGFVLTTPHAAAGPFSSVAPAGQAMPASTHLQPVRYGRSHRFHGRRFGHRRFGI
ncbi:MAG: hypothetical protein AAF732_17635, partial [Pseudomonadota bacterium]